MNITGGKHEQGHFWEGVLEIDRSRGTGRHFAYYALAEYDDFAARFRMRTPAEIDALEIRARP